MTGTAPKWLREPEPHDFAAADHFLRLVLHKRHVALALKRLRNRRMKSRSFAAKDILRAAELACLPPITRASLRSSQITITASRSLEAYASSGGPMASPSPHRAPLAGAAIRRLYPREEPSAVVPRAGIRAGGSPRPQGEGLSLPRPSGRSAGSRLA